MMRKELTFYSAAAIAAWSREEMFEKLRSGEHGLDEAEAKLRLEEYGRNELPKGKRTTVIRRIAISFSDPFSLILMVLAVFSFITDYVVAPAESKSLLSPAVIGSMLLISGIIRLVQDSRSCMAADRLSAMIKTSAAVERSETGIKEIPAEYIVPGDLVHLSAGDLVPADMRIIRAKDFFVNESAVTGESEPAEKFTGGSAEECIVYMGTSVESGSALGIVYATGAETMLGGVSQHTGKKREMTSFEKGVRSVSRVLIRFMLAAVPAVFIINGMTDGNWLDAALFAISAAIGLTPEMLPMIVTASLARGAVHMSRRKVIVKELNAIQNIGSMDVLCTDKTGTLTCGRSALELFLNVTGEEDNRVLRHAFLNSYYQTGLRSLMDEAIIERAEDMIKRGEFSSALINDYVKADEIPFDFERRRMSVVVCGSDGKTQLITKGAVEELLKISSHVEYNGEILELTEELKRKVRSHAEHLGEMGMRVIGVAQKNKPEGVGGLKAEDEREMVLIGWLAFLDPPKPSAQTAVKQLNKSGVRVKILTGDNELVTRYICERVGIECGKIITGDELEQMNSAEFKSAASEYDIFARVSPQQKADIVRILREGGHAVGYMGDGINDAAAMRSADVGISVDSAVDIAKETADVILLEKDLDVLSEGVNAGRKTYANMIKYIKLTASSNFGNMMSILAAAALLPFLPMAPVHILLLNLIYDISCIALPWDNTDSEQISEPRQWGTASVSRFMIGIGPVSTVFDMIIFAIFYFVICPHICGGTYSQLGSDMQRVFAAVFQTGWFISSMWSQTAAIHVLRTSRVPFIKSRASAPVMLMTFAGAAVLTAIPYTSVGAALGMSALPIEAVIFIAAVTVLYIMTLTAARNIYVKRCGSLL